MPAGLRGRDIVDVVLGTCSRSADLAVTDDPGPFVTPREHICQPPFRLLYHRAFSATVRQRTEFVFGIDTDRHTDSVHASKQRPSDRVPRHCHSRQTVSPLATDSRSSERKSKTPSKLADQLLHTRSAPLERSERMGWCSPIVVVKASERCVTAARIHHCIERSMTKPAGTSRPTVMTVVQIGAVASSPSLRGPTPAPPSSTPA